MLFIVPWLLLATEPYLCTDLHKTLIATAISLSSLQIIESTIKTNDAFSSILAGALSLTLSLPLSLFLLLLGAPAVDYQLETLLLSAILSTLGIQPLIHKYGVSSKAWQKIFSLEPPLSKEVYGLLGMALGAWLGIVPIALDWDRVWQTYPITIVLGSYIGYGIGSLLGPYLVYANI